jgi:Icc-related predicted phosphoesterase
MSSEGESIGAKSLRQRVYEVMPKVCCFGHIHEANGCMVDTDNDITFMNSSICDRKYNPVGRAHVFDLESKI